MRPLRSCPTEDKYLYLYCLLKFRLLPLKVLIFVSDLNKCFRLKLFLQTAGLAAAVLNSELPANSRQSIVEQFNKGKFQILLATDESASSTLSKQGQKRGSAAARGKKGRRGASRVKKDAEYGVARGVDFRDVASVVNFDVPENEKTYTHRIGRTSRGGMGVCCCCFPCHFRPTPISSQFLLHCTLAIIT